MLRALYTSATGMKAQELMIDNTANNLANVNTNGFKRSQMDFADLLYLTLQDAGGAASQGATSPVALQIGSGVRPAGTTKLFTQGTVEETGNPLDIAIQGDGFLKVALPDGGERYTRDGALRLNSENELVTIGGLRLTPGVTIGTEIIPSSIKIDSDGTISGRTPGATQATAISNIQLYRFPNPAGLSSEGGNLYSATEASGAEQVETPGRNGAGTILQSYLERSNVEVVTELISLITAQRAYEVNSRAIRAGDEMLSTTNEIVR